MDKVGCATAGVQITRTLSGLLHPWIRPKLADYAMIVGGGGCSPIRSGITTSLRLYRVHSAIQCY